MSSPEILIDLLSPDERDVLTRCCDVMNEQAQQMSVRPLGRIGHTPARLYAAYFAEGRGGFPFVVKIGPRKQLAAEMAAIDAVKSFYEDALTGKFVPGGGHRDAIVHPLHSEKPGDTEIVELRDLVYDPAGIDDEAAHSDAIALLNAVYENCCTLAHHVDRQSLRLGDEYDHSDHDYLRGRGATSKFALHFGQDVRTDAFEFLGAEIWDPRAVLEWLLDVRLEAALGVVHGDLHSNNIVIGHARQPHLIDFAWAHQSGHVFIDYVLMESSLRFLLFPHFAELDQQRAVDELFLHEHGPEEIDSVVADNALAPYYRRMAALVAVIRGAARTACGGSLEFEEYLASQFLVLYGTLAYADYNFLAATRALGLIGARVRGTL